MSSFSDPHGLGKESKVIGVTANLSGSQYATSVDPLSAASPHRQSFALAPSLIFCIFLHLDILPERDAMYALVYALLAEAAVVLKTPGAGATACIVMTVTGLGTAVSLLARSLLSFKSYQATTQIAEGEPRPMFFPVQTSHTRLFPKVHSLSYPFLWTGIPIGLRGNVRGVLSVESKIEGRRPAWFSIDSCDYMGRGRDEIGLDGKLHDFLLSQEANPNDYPFAYLITVAKFSRHAFNPVSFWYLYSAARTLSAVILEVNNTFGERHLYFLSSSSTLSSSSNEPHRFTSAFRKDFFVSPFNDRSGTYSLVTNDPLFPHMTGTGLIKLTITLSSNDGRPKLVARVTSRGEPVDPAKMSWTEIQKFAMGQAWNTWATEPRTVYQAGLLMFKRGLSIFTVPEPLKTSISRKAKEHEAVIERVFRQYLQAAVRGAKGNLTVRYTPAGLPGCMTETIKVLAARSPGKKETAEATIRVLTPLFYARMVRYGSVAEALLEEAKQRQTLEVEGLDDFIFRLRRDGRDGRDAECAVRAIKYGLMDRMMMRSILLLRRPPKPLINPTWLHVDNQEKSSKQEGFDEREEENDLVSLCADPEEARSYRLAILKLLLSDWLAAGNLDLLAMERLIMRLGLIWMVGNGLRDILHRVSL